MSIHSPEPCSAANDLPLACDDHSIDNATNVGNRPHYALLLGAALLVGAGSKAQADDQETSTLNPLVVTATSQQQGSEDRYALDTTSTAGKRPVAFLDDPHTVNVVTQQILQDQGGRSLDDAMKNVAGVSMGNNMGGTELGYVKRGFGSNQDGSVLIDGIRQPRGPYPMATIDHVEALMGPSSMFRGQQDPGGVINLVSKRPLFTPQVVLSGQAVGDRKGAGTLDITGPLGNSGFAYRFIVDHQDKDSWREFGNNRHTLVAPTLRYEGEHNRGELAWRYSDYDLDLDRGTIFVKGKPVSVSRKQRFDEPWAGIKGHDNSLSAWWEHDLDADWKTRTTYAYIRRQYDDGQPRVTKVSAANGNITRRADANHGFDRRIQYVAQDLIADTELFGMRHELTFGADHEFQRDYLRDKYNGKTVTDTNLYSNRHSYLPLDPGSVNSANSNRLDQSKSYGVYLTDSVHLTDRWVLGVGGRYNWFKQYGGRGRPFNESLNSVTRTFLPSANLLYRASDSTSLYLSYSESFVPNGSDSETGQSLDPEHGKGYELGLKHQWSSALLGSITLYRLRKNNVAVSDNGVTRTIGKAGSEGAEFNLSGAITPTLSVDASYAFTHTKVISDSSGNVGNRLPNAPRHSASLFLAQQLNTAPEWGKWRLGGGVRYVGGREGDDDNSFQMKHYTVSDLFVAWNPAWMGERARIQLNLNNLFDERYYTSSGGSTRVSVGAPRELVATTSMRW
ncbi:Metal-pseudopaline receptor CntO [Carnimonas sp. R-84981]|uniref:TonB-dependent siderophore receptor n=1 Tax=Carnimonas bestiolae TaxID=3402172 RepID=UPI003EDC6179